MRRDDGRVFPREEGREWVVVVLRRPSFLVSVSRSRGRSKSRKGGPLLAREKNEVGIGMSQIVSKGERMNKKV